MKTIDQILRTLVNDPQLVSILQPADVKALRGLVSTIDNHVFLTAGQSQFCLTLLNTIKSSIRGIEPDIYDALLTPTWSKPFRNIEYIKKMSIATDDNTGSKHILIESNYSNSFRNFMLNLYKTVPMTMITSGKEFHSPLTEHHIVELVNSLSPLGFDISDEILEYYDTICSWDQVEINNQFTLTNIADDAAQAIIMDDIGKNTNLDSLIVADRRLRHQYQIPQRLYDFSADPSLTEIIAKRSTPKLWINNTKYTLSELIASLRELNRLPILFVFENTDAIKTCASLYGLSESLVENNITDGVGIYFRLDNSSGKQFNTFIADHNYNQQLDKDLTIAGILAGTLPKFFLKSDWEPKTVIAINNNSLGVPSKTAVYATRCDLIITYTKEQPIMLNSSRW
jgi:hypothetical protein